MRPLASPERGGGGVQCAGCTMTRATRAWNWGSHCHFQCPHLAPSPRCPLLGPVDVRGVAPGNFAVTVPLGSWEMVSGLSGSPRSRTGAPITTSSGGSPVLSHGGMLAPARPSCPRAGGHAGWGGGRGLVQAVWGPAPSVSSCASGLGHPVGLGIVCGRGPRALARAQVELCGHTGRRPLSVSAVSIRRALALRLCVALDSTPGASGEEVAAWLWTLRVAVVGSFSHLSLMSQALRRARGYGDALPACLWLGV